MKQTVAMVGQQARAQHAAYLRAAAGQMTGTIPCPRCSSTIRFTCLGRPDQTTGRCNSGCGVRWAQ